MIIGAMNLDIRIYDSHSLKDKRTVISSLKDKLRKKFNISIIESSFQDLWQKSRISIVMVSNIKKNIDQSFDKIEEFIYKNMSGEILNSQREYL